MSLINKMLQELDRRHAPQSAGTPPGLVQDRSLQPVRGATPMVGSEWFWRLVAVLILITIGWIAWVAWQVTPRASVTELALQSANRAAPVPVAAAPAAASSPVAAAPPAASAPAPAALPPSPTPVLQADGAKREPERPDTRKLAMEIRTTIKERGAGAPGGTQAEPGPAPKRGASLAPVPNPEPLAKAAIKLETALASPRRALRQPDRSPSATAPRRAIARRRSSGAR